MPDIDAQFVQRYASEGLVAVALDPQRGERTDDLPGVIAYAENLDLSMLPVGVETTNNYEQWSAQFPGSNPFPIDIIVDKRGIVRYVAREYDAPTMHTIVQQLLAE